MIQACWNKPRSLEWKIYSLPPAAERVTSLESVDIDLDDRLYPHQKEGVLKAAAWGRAMIGDEMGVGKSAQAIALIKHFGGRALVVCPSYLVQKLDPGMCVLAP